MFSHAKMFLLATATAVAFPALANSATFDNEIRADRNYSFASTIAPNETVEFRFTVLEDLFIQGFSVAATGSSSEADVRAITFGLVQPVTGKFTTVGSADGVAGGFGFIDGMSFDAGSKFSVLFEDGITNPVGLALSFGTETVTAVPVPAAGLLLAPFLLLGGLFGALRRRSAAALA